MSAGAPRLEVARPMAGRSAYVLLHNTSEIVTPDEAGERILRYPRGAVVFRDGRVLEIGSAAELSRRHPADRPLTANGRLGTPGLSDRHTHMIFATHPAVEVPRRLAARVNACTASSAAGHRPSS